jgi:hypothetical protein
MATKKVKKLAFGGMSNAVRAAADKAATQIQANPRQPALTRGGGQPLSQDVIKKFADARQALTGKPSGLGQVMSQPKVGLGTAMGIKKMGGIGAALGKKMGMKKGGMTKGYAAGGMSMVDKEKNPGLAKLPTEVRNKMGYMKKGGNVEESKAMVKKEIGFMKKAGAPKSMIKHEMAEAKGMKKGGMAECKTVAKKEVKSHEKRMHGMAKGGSIDGCAIRGKTKTSMVKMKRGGSC